jgi:hypothetical protein
LDIFLLQQQQPTTILRWTQHADTTTIGTHNHQGIDVVDATAATLLVPSNMLPLFHLQHQYLIHFFALNFSSFRLMFFTTIPSYVLRP